MNEKKFAVGQVWRNRDGKLQTITNITEDVRFPVETDIDCYTSDGKYYPSGGHSEDLIELVQDINNEQKLVEALKLIIECHTQQWSRLRMVEIAQDTLKELGYDY